MRSDGDVIAFFSVWFLAIYLLLYWIVVVLGRGIPFKGVHDSVQHWQWYTGEGPSLLFCCYMTKAGAAIPGLLHAT